MSYCHHLSELIRFRLKHVDLLFDRANDNQRAGTPGAVTSSFGLSLMPSLAWAEDLAEGMSAPVSPSVPQTSL